MSAENKYQFKGTPAPWEVQRTPALKYKVVDASGFSIATLGYKSKDDACLSAAAPELLQACIEAYKELQFHNWHNTKTGFELTAAIHKALNIQD